MTTPICLTSYLAFKTAPRAGEGFLALRLQNQGCTVEDVNLSNKLGHAVQDIWLLREMSSLTPELESREPSLKGALGFPLPRV